MLNLDDLTQLTAFYRYGTLTRVAEEFHISQPTITRTMKRIEESFGVPLFRRTANRIELNEVGIRAAEYAEDLLRQAEQCRSRVLDYDRKLHSLNVYSCAPAPLWDLLPVLSRKYSDRTIASRVIADEEQIMRDLREKNCDMGILTRPFHEPGFCSEEYEEEHLYLNVPADHELSRYSEITADIINGYNCLLSPEIGFWENFCKNRLPNSRFLVQHDQFAFEELIRSSSLPCFTTDLARGLFLSIPNRVDIPITDPDAHAVYYIVKPK